MLCSAACHRTIGLETQYTFLLPAAPAAEPPLSTHIGAAAAAAAAVSSVQSACSLPTELPPALAVLDVGTNEFTGSLPAIPATLRYLGASNNSITGPLPALPGASQLRFMYLQSNQLTGGLPPSLIDGRAPLLLLDLHSNKLSGPLDSAAAAAAAVGGASSRRLLQQQGGASGDQQQAGGSGGSAWSFDTLALLDLSRNGFSGEARERCTLCNHITEGKLEDGCFQLVF
jgi:hypothetical protein